MSLRSRLAILFGMVGFVASALVGGFAYGSAARELRASTDTFLRARSTETASAIRDLAGELPQNGTRPPNGSGRIFDGRPVADDDAIIQVVRSDGAIVSSSIELPITDAAERLRTAEPARNASAPSRLEDVTVDGVAYRMISRALSQGGVVQVARSTAEDDALKSALLRRFMLIAAGVAAAAAAVGWLIAARTTAPLRRLATAASDVAETRDFTTDVGVDGRSDEIGRLASSFRTMLDALESSRVQQHRLIHDAGHELRTPLTSLRANVAMLERAGDLPADERNEILAAIRSELVELGDLFDEMIDLATDQRDDDIVMQPVDLHGLARELAARWERRSARSIEVELSHDPVTVMGDPAMLERAINNLVSNADKFSPAGTTITIAGEAGTVRVLDRGPGIAPADRDRIFDRFYRSDATRSMPGSGLGLSIVAQIVERHGGTVWATERSGGGADVGFRLQTVSAGSDA